MHHRMIRSVEEEKWGGRVWGPGGPRYSEIALAESLWRDILAEKGLPYTPYVVVTDLDEYRKLNMDETRCDYMWRQIYRKRREQESAKAIESEKKKNDEDRKKKKKKKEKVNEATTTIANESPTTKLNQHIRFQYESDDEEEDSEKRSNN